MPHGSRVDLSGIAAVLAKSLEGVDIPAAEKCVDRFDELTEEEKDAPMHDAPVVVHRMNIRAALKTQTLRRVDSVRRIGATAPRRWSRRGSGRPSGVRRAVRRCARSPGRRRLAEPHPEPLAVPEPAR